jgi:hypothetical protein
MVLYYPDRKETRLNPRQFGDCPMRNNHPKSESPAMKEHAALDKTLVARQKTTEAEKAAHAPHNSRVAETKPKPQVPKP